MKLALRELEIEFRNLADDQVKPSFRWSSDEVARYATEAQIDACERAQLIEDDTTPEVCKITVKEGKPMYELSPLIQRVLRARLDSQSAPLRTATRDELDCRGPWEEVTGQPWAFLDLETKIRLVWIPSADDVLRLVVKRLPKCELKKETDFPEINPRYHFRLLVGMLARAYMKKDTETYDPQKSERHEAAFTRSFGAKPDANVERKRRAKRLHVTKTSPYA